MPASKSQMPGAFVPPPTAPGARACVYTNAYKRPRPCPQNIAGVLGSRTPCSTSYHENPTRIGPSIRDELGNRLNRYRWIDFHDKRDAADIDRSASLGGVLSNYCRMQSAKAGPGLLLHVAASPSAVFEKAIVPPGHVTETNFSPALHSRLQLALPSHLSSLSACSPVDPAEAAPA